MYTVSDEGETIEDIVNSDDDGVELIEFSKVNPTKYRAEVYASEPFILSFAESYERDLWMAKVNGRVCSSIPLNGVVNGFYIEDTGDLEIVIEYKPQSWLYYGAAITGISIILALAFLMLHWRRRRKTGS